MKVYDLKTKKAKGYKQGYSYNLRISKNGSRMIVNGYTNARSLRILDPSNMKLISEKLSLTTPIYNAQMSPGNRWMVINSNRSAYIWDLQTFSKYAELKDPTASDSSFISSFYFLNDSERVVTSGNNYKQLKLSIFNILKRKVTKLIKTTGYTVASGFMNNEFYYADATSLNIINLQSMKEEKYLGNYSLAGLPQYKMINFRCV